MAQDVDSRAAPARPSGGVIRTVGGLQAETVYVVEGMEGGARREVPPAGSGLRQSCEINVGRRERKKQRETEAGLANLTARQRLGLGLSKLTQEQLDAVVQRLATDAAAGDTKAVHAIVRLLDQSFGRAGQEEPADPRSTDEKPWEEWTEAERASYRQALLAQREREDAGPESHMIKTSFSTTSL